MVKHVVLGLFLSGLVFVSALLATRSAEVEMLDFSEDFSSFNTSSMSGTGGWFATYATDPLGSDIGGDGIPDGEDGLGNDLGDGVAKVLDAVDDSSIDADEDDTAQGDTFLITGTADGPRCGCSQSVAQDVWPISSHSLLRCWGLYGCAVVEPADSVTGS